MFNIKDEIAKLPDKPGIYIFKDKKSRIIYIGKAKNLINRVRQYFQSSKDKPLRTQNMISNIASFDYIITDNEIEALILESNLIKENSPKYNVLLKDDKSYPYIIITTSEAFPRIFMTRNVKKDKNKYYGPFTNIKAVKDTIEIIHNIWKLKTCNRNLPQDIGKDRPCLNYHINRCKAPCAGLISEEDYKKDLLEARDLLDGRYQDIIKKLELKMNLAAEEMQFEQAAEYRDNINSIVRVNEKQKMEKTSANIEQDVIAISKSENEGLAQMFMIRAGKMIGHEHFFLTNVADETYSKVTSEFVKQFYNNAALIPKEIIVNTTIIEQKEIENWLSKMKNSKVVFTRPQKGEKRKLVNLAAKNASNTLTQYKERLLLQERRKNDAIFDIKNAMNIDSTIKRIEAYDISNIQGVESVGSMVVFEAAKANRSAYRKFKIKSIIGPDDYASMKEVLSRRFKRYLKEKYEIENNIIKENEAKFNILPDLILVDGGKGQVNVALEVLDELNLNIKVAGMLKDDKHNTKALLYDNIERYMEKNSEGFKLITRIQDEVHRFAIEYHRSLRQKTSLKSILDDIDGVGPKRRKALLRHFSSVENIKKASLDELLKVDSINKTVANSIYNFFNKNK